MSAAKNLRSRRWALGFARLVLGAAFLYAALLKMASPRDFADSIAAYQMLPLVCIDPVALALPFFELAAGLLVLTGFFLRVGALGMTALLLIFTAATLSAQLRGLPVDCGCFGPHSALDSTPWLVLTRDGILLAFAVFVYSGALRRRAGSNAPS